MDSGRCGFIAERSADRAAQRSFFPKAQNYLERSFYVNRSGGAEGVLLARIMRGDRAATLPERRQSRRCKVRVVAAQLKISRSGTNNARFRLVAMPSHALWFLGYHG